MYQPYCINLRNFLSISIMYKIIILFVLSYSLSIVNAQVKDTIVLPPASFVNTDTSLRIINMNPYFSLHVDSSLSYRLMINKPQKNYYWYLKNAPVGLRVDKDNGTLSFKADKNIFRSGRLKYDTEYPVRVGVQSLINPNDKIDTTFAITWYNTDVVLPRV